MPRLLDLFSCAGGAAMGYHRAGFDVVGVDSRDVLFGTRNPVMAARHGNRDDKPSPAHREEN